MSQADAAKAAGSCKAAVTTVNPPIHIILFIVNIFCPGWGTIISSFIGKEGFCMNALIFGLLQFFLSWTIVCWIWSIMHGYWIYQKAA